jgi:hypothetical protein
MVSRSLRRDGVDQDIKNSIEPLFRSKASKKLIDMTGVRIGRLTVLERAPNAIVGDTSKTRWMCLCDCGSITTVMRDDLIRKTRSCGCLAAELTLARNRARKGTKRPKKQEGSL